jgi:hypothetical protein
LSNARAQAELFYDANGNKYFGTINSADDVCSVNALATGNVKGIYPSVLAATQVTQGSGGALVANGVIETSTTGACNAAASTWVAQAPLKTSGTGYYCVDSTGAGVVETGVLAAAATKCP